MSIHLGGAANIATVIDKYLARRKDELEDVFVRTFIDTHTFEILKADPAGDVFKWYSGFVLPYTRPFANQRGCGIYTPASWHLVPDFVRKQYSFDILYFVTAPMNEAGFFSFGLTIADTLSVTEVAQKVVVVVREDMPCTFGGQEEGIHISDVDYIVEDREFETFCLPEVPVKKADRMIAENILSAGLIEDGTTLQVGIGGLPNSVLDALPDTGVKHCGLHTEMVTENMVDLIEKGIVDNSRKKLDCYKSVCTFALGSKRLYRFFTLWSFIYEPKNAQRGDQLSGMKQQQMTNTLQNSVFKHCGKGIDGSIKSNDYSSGLANLINRNVQSPAWLHVPAPEHLWHTF